jgi:hypothetical protein
MLDLNPCPQRKLEREIRKYEVMYEATPQAKWMTRRLIANKLDRLRQEYSTKYRTDGVTERVFEEFKLPAGRGVPPRDPAFIDEWCDYK